jgi:Ca2+-binding EF-hand superfamily protein
MILTIEEIRKNLIELDLNLSETDITDLLKIIDKNSDGSVDK